MLFYRPLETGEPTFEMHLSRSWFEENRAVEELFQNISMQMYVIIIIIIIIIIIKIIITILVIIIIIQKNMLKTSQKRKNMKKK